MRRYSGARAVEQAACADAEDSFQWLLRSFIVRLAMPSCVSGMQTVKFLIHDTGTSHERCFLSHIFNAAKDMCTRRDVQSNFSSLDSVYSLSFVCCEI